uniref:Uncharacterized protein n=1 Tax=Panagrolaimus sp. JU765 TaxID=591449 RepID=A0AC34QD78_9BILA
MNLSDLCEATWEVHQNSDFKLVLSLVLSLNLIALVLNCSVIYGIVLSKTLHVHLRILFLHLDILILYRTTCTTIRAGRLIIYPLFVNSPCDLLWSYTDCKIFSSVCKLPLDLLIYAYLTVSIERLIATIFHKKYEKRSQKTLCLIFGCCLPWIIPIVQFINDVKSIYDSPNFDLIYCSSLSSGTWDMDWLIRVQIPLCVLCMGLCLIAFFTSLFIKKNSLNSRKTTSLESLSSRYQLVENIRTTKFVVPNILAYCITLIIHILLLMYANTKRFDSVIEFAVAKEWSSFILPLYANTFPIIFLFGFEESTKKGCFQLFSRKLNQNRKKIVVPLGTTNDYFQHYQKQWK